MYVVGGENMYPTLRGGCRPVGPNCHDDHVVFDLLAGTSREVHRGDILVFQAPGGWTEGEPVKLVSRVIAVGGQTVKGVANGRVMISDHGKKGPYRMLDEPYVFIDRGQRGTVRRFGPVTVPGNRLWVMGDHRNDSADSRYHCGIGGTDALNDTNCNSKASTIAVTSVIGIADKIIAPSFRVASLK
jgi:signal peptidase I